MALNSLCMPGLAYHFICLIRGWGLDLTSPPLFGIYPPSAAELVTQARRRCHASVVPDC